MENRFPPLSSNPSDEFLIESENLQDLFYDGGNIDEEIFKLQNLLRQSSSRNILRKIYGITPMNRLKFREFVLESCNLDGDVPDEIFSCAVNNFADEGSDILPDEEMTKNEFATAFVRLANLWSLMMEGMSESSHLTKQTNVFLKRFQT